jgi:Putative Ig domain
MKNLSLLLAVGVVLMLSGCSSSSKPSVSLSPGTAQIIDQGQQRSFTATVAHDSTNAGATWTCSGAACTTLTNVSTTSATFSASGTTGTAMITAASVKLATASSSVVVTVTAVPAISTTQAQVTAAPATAGVAYNLALAGTGGAGTLTWSAVGLPANGLSINSSTGAISGTPTAKGTINFTVTVTDSSTAGPKTASAPFILTINNPAAPTITTTQAQLTAGPATAGSVYGFTFHASGTGALTWSAVGLPADALALAASTGIVSGTPTSKATISFTLTVSDTFGQSSAATAFILTVNNPPAPAITTTQTQVTAAPGTVGSVYSFTFHASGTGTLTWSAVGLVDGLSLNSSTGVVSGTPTSKQSVSFTLTATDTFGQSSPATAFSITVNNPAAPVISTTPAQVPSATVNVAYGFTFQGSGFAPLTWSTTPLLSDGLSINASTGKITGTPTTATTLNFSVTLTDGVGQATTVSGFSIVVSTESIAFTPSAPTTVTAGGTLSVNATVSSDPGNGGVNWSVTCASAACGSFVASHTASGTATTYDAPPTPPTGGTVTITAAAADAPSPQVSAVVTVNALPLSITTSSLPNGTVNTAYSATITASGGVPPYTFSLDAASSALPTPLAFNAGSPSATITGTPTAASTTNNIIVDVKDSEGTPMTAQKTYSLTINAVTAACNKGNESVLAGQYAFQLQGFDSNGPVGLIGSFTADGTGKITAGEEDLNDSTTGTTPPPLSIIAAGSFYSVGLDTNGGYRGCMTIATSAATSTYRFALNQISSNVAFGGQLIEFDSTGTNVTGGMYQQTAAAFSNTQVSGNYAFGASTTESLTLSQRFAMAGVFSVSGTTISSGSVDTDENGNVNNHCTTPCIFTGTRGSPDSNGRTTFSITPTGATSPVNMVYYTVFTGALVMMNTDTQANNAPYVGTIMQQSGEPFSNSSLSGTSVIYTVGLSGSTPPTADVQVGLLAFPSVGNFTINNDENDGGTISSNSISGTYSVASNGRVTLPSGGGGHSPVFYLVKPGKGFMVGTDSSVTAGSFEPQSPGPFLTSSTVFGFGTISPAEQNIDYEAGWVNFNGSGTVSGATDDTSLFGGQNVDNTFSQTYAVASNGRGTVGSSSTPNVIFYVVSGTKAILFNAYNQAGTQGKADPAVEVAQH